MSRMGEKVVSNASTRLTNDPVLPPAEDDDHFDDDMLVPKLAKHMQSHHDREIDRQIHIQNDLLHELQRLKKEVDEYSVLCGQGHDPCK
jgi:hypothetical protein